MNKELIKQRFEKSLKTYNDNAIVQKQMAGELISMLDKKTYPKLLEIGCGTGILTEILTKRINFQSYKANDIVKKCGEYIKNINPKIDFVYCEAEQIARENQVYDLIISNAAFQWIENLENLLPMLMNRLNSGGTLIFSTFGEDNFKEIYQACGMSLKYYSDEDWRQILKNFHYIFKKEEIVLSFKTPLEVLKHLKYTGVNSISNMAWTKTDMFKFEKAYNNCCNNKPTLTYNPVFIKIENISK